MGPNRTGVVRTSAFDDLEQSKSHSFSKVGTNPEHRQMDLLPRHFPATACDA